MKNFFMKFIDIIDLRMAISYMIVGLCSAIVYLCTFGFFYEIKHLDYRIAVSIGYLASILIHFTANRRFTFKSHGFNFYKHLCKYLCIILINYLITLSITCLVVEYFMLPAYIGVGCSIGITVGIGYVTAKFWIFRHQIT